MKDLKDDPSVSPRVREYHQELERQAAETQRLIDDRDARAAANGEAAQMMATAQSIGASGRRMRDSDNYEPEVDVAQAANQNLTHVMLRQAMENRR